MRHQWSYVNIDWYDKKRTINNIGEKMSEEQKVNQPQNDAQEVEVKKTETDE